MVDRLLHDDHRDAGVAEGSQPVVHPPGGLRGQTEGELVDQEQSRRRDQRHGEGEHVLLTAGEVTGALGGPFLEAREQVERVGERGA